jgi:hypothetical protein
MPLTTKMPELPLLPGLVKVIEAIGRFEPRAARFSVVW